jgi:hypothetical protein
MGRARQFHVPVPAPIDKIRARKWRLSPFFRSLLAVATISFVEIVVAVQSAQCATQDFTDRAAFTAAVTNPTTIGFSGILPPGVPYQAFSPLVRSGITFSSQVSGSFVDVTTATYYSPNNYPSDFLLSIRLMRAPTTNL